VAKDTLTTEDLPHVGNFLEQVGCGSDGYSIRAYVDSLQLLADLYTGLDQV